MKKYIKFLLLLLLLSSCKVVYEYEAYIEKKEMISLLENKNYIVVDNLPCSPTTKYKTLAATFSCLRTLVAAFSRYPVGLKPSP